MVSLVRLVSSKFSCFRPTLLIAGNFTEDQIKELRAYGDVEGIYEDAVVHGAGFQLQFVILPCSLMA